jgi:hypothetical protein
VYASPPAASHSRPGRGTRSHRGRTAIRGRLKRVDNRSAWLGKLRE